MVVFEITAIHDGRICLKWKKKGEILCFESECSKVLSLSQECGHSMMSVRREGGHGVFVQFFPSEGGVCGYSGNGLRGGRHSKFWNGRKGDHEPLE